MKAKRLLLSLAVFLLSSFIIVYIIVQLVSGLTTDVSYQYAVSTDVDDFIEKDGYIVRSETLLLAKQEGIVTYSAKESQKIGVNQLIATVFENTKNVGIQNEIDRLDKKIDLLERCTVDTSYLTSDVNKIDNKIYQSITNSRSAVFQNNLELATQEKENLLVSFNKRQLITDKDSRFQERIQQLKNEKNNLTASLHSPIASVYCNTPGYFSTLLDGYESIFTPEAVETLSINSFHQLISEEKNTYSKLAIGKIITDFHWFTLCEVSKKEAEEFSAGKEYKLSYLYSSGKKINGSLDKIVTQTDADTAILVFRIEDVPSDFDYTRVQKVKIIKSSTNGISFPRSALRMVDGVQGVYVVAGNTVGFKKTDIIHENDGSYISKEFTGTDSESKSYLSRFDRVITEGKNLYVGKVLD